MSVTSHVNRYRVKYGMREVSTADSPSVPTRIRDGCMDEIPLRKIALIVVESGNFTEEESRNESG